jgi:Domain of unknown function (DUF4331)
MNNSTKWLLAGGVMASIATLWVPLPSRAADHLDPLGIMTVEPTADITDLYAWMSPDTNKLNLILNVGHSVGAATSFSTAVSYAMHVTSMPSYGSADIKTTQVICKSFVAGKIECWAGSEYVTGNVGDTLTSTSGKMKVFTGRRNDPFFFELVGFQETVKKVVAAAPSLTFDTNGCPALDATTSGLLVKQLQSSGAIAASTDNTKPAKDTFAGSNVLSIVVQLDKTLVNEKGNVIAVSSSTHRAL